METICIKINEDFAKAIEKHIKKNHYTTKTEFFRESVRNTLKQEERKEKEIKETLKNIKKYYGSSKTKTTDEDLHRVREELAKEWENEMNN